MLREVGDFGVVLKLPLLFTNRKFSPENTKDKLLKDYPNALIVTGDNFKKVCGILGNRIDLTASGEDDSSKQAQSRKEQEIDDC